MNVTINARFAPLLLLGLLSVVTMATTARAAPASVRESLAPETRAKFDAATALYKVARYAEAREVFLALYAQSGDARILFNVAVCDKALGRYARAIATLQKSLASPDRPLPAEYTKRAAEAVATLSRYVAYVTLEPTVEGASLSVDGEALRDNPVALDTGDHVASASKDGHDPATVEFTVKAGESSRVKLVLQPSTRPGTTRITCAGGATCEIRVGDQVLGPAPITFKGPAGTYL